MDALGVEPRSARILYKGLPSVETITAPSLLDPCQAPSLPPRIDKLISVEHTIASRTSDQ